MTTSDVFVDCIYSLTPDIYCLSTPPLVPPLKFIFFLVFCKAKSFSPNFEMDTKFSEVLSEVRKRGIKIFVTQISFNGKTIYYNGRIPLADF